MDNYNDFGPPQTVFGDYWRNQLWQWLENDAITSYGSGWRKDAITSYGSGWRKDAVTSYGSGWREDAVTSYGSGWRERMP